MLSQLIILRIALLGVIILIASSADAGVMDGLTAWHSNTTSFDATPSLAAVSDFDWDDSEDSSEYSQFDSASSWGVVGGPGTTIDFSGIHATWAFVQDLAFAGLVCCPPEHWPSSPIYSLLKVPRSSF